MSSEGGGVGRGHQVEEGRGGSDDEVPEQRMDIRRRRRTEDPSSSRQRAAEAVWPEHFVESLAVQVAVDASRSGGRLAAAPALAALFQVCSTWRNVSRSELLWQQVTGRVWCRRRSSLPSWRDEFVRLHRMASNFRSRRSTCSHLLPPPTSLPALACCRLALSDAHLAAGFLDGSVRLFDLPAGRPLATYRPDPHRDRLGQFSRSVSGLVLLPDPDRLVFAFRDGDIHVAPLDDPISVAAARRARVGSLVEDGTLVDFTADDRRWVGLFAGVPGRSWQVWDAETEQLVYVGGTLTDADAVSGWRMLTDSDVSVLGRARIAAPGIAVGCTGTTLQVVHLTDGDVGEVANEQELLRGAVVSAVDACDGRTLVLESRGWARVIGVPTLEEVCRFSTVRRAESQRQQQQQRRVAAGCMNWGYAILWSGQGVVRVWDAMTGQYLYSFSERIGSAAGAVVAANDRYAAAWVNDSGLHLWDFGLL